MSTTLLAITLLICAFLLRSQKILYIMIIEEGKLRHLGVVNYLYQYNRTNDLFYDKSYYNVNVPSHQQLSKIQKTYRSQKYHILTFINWILGSVRYDATTGNFDFTPEKRI